MGYLNLTNIKNELLNFVRNSDVLSTTIRGVTTSTDTGTFDDDSTYTLATNPTKVKNVRSVTVASTLLSYGTDYTVNFVSGVISFTSSQSGDYTIIYDQGTGDKIYDDYPRDDLTISSFPRISVDIISMTSEALGLGNENVTSVLFTVVVYADKQKTITNALDTMRQEFIDNHKFLYYLGRVKPESLGPMIPSENKNNQILQQNIDFSSKFNFEIN